MIAPRYRIGIWATVLIALGCLVVAAVRLDGLDHLTLGCIFGSIFGHTTLASAWTAWGPGRLVVRLPLSLFWLTLLAAAFGLNMLFHGPFETDVVIITSACILGQWLLVQIPLWGLAAGYGLRLRHRDDGLPPLSARERQFGIRELMIFTAIVGVVFGIGRLVVTNWPAQFNLGLGRETPIFIFLAVAAIVVTLPLLLAALLRRMAIPAVAVVLVLVGLATAWELPLLTKFHSGPGPDALHLVWINTFTAAWIVLFVIVVRLSGYQLVRAGSTVV